MKIKFTTEADDEAIITVGLPFFRRQAEVEDGLERGGYGPRMWRFKNSRVPVPFLMRMRLNLRQTLYTIVGGLGEYLVDSWRSRRRRRRLEAAREDWTPVSKFPTARLLEKEDA